MERIRKHLSYANVAATLALVFGMTGGAVAATGGFSSGGKLQACVNEEGGLKLLKPGKKCKKGQKALAWNQTGPAGATGSAGTNGANGASGPQGSSGAQGVAGESNVTTKRIDVAVPGGTERAEIVNFGEGVLAACNLPPIATNGVALQAFAAPGLYWKRNGAVTTDMEGFVSDTNAMNIDVFLSSSEGRVGHVRLHATHEGSSCHVEGILTIVS
jgi:hypothetical protein